MSFSWYSDIEFGILCRSSAVVWLWRSATATRLLDAVSAKLAHWHPVYRVLGLTFLLLNAHCRPEPATACGRPSWRS
jgi:hypothetical protein